MSNYPEKTCQLDALVTHKKLVDAAVSGRKTQQRRNGVYGYPGETFELRDQTFRMVRLEHVPLKEMTEEDAIAEGFPNLEAYKDLILRMHKGMPWDPEHFVWLHEFEKI
jgi:hypothetical protein